MNKKDLKIITQLRTDARMPLTDMSRKINMPVSTIFDRMKSNNLITKHTSLLDFSKLGYTRANIFLKVEREDKEQLKESLLKNQSINSVYRINNGFDFLIECVFRQMKEVEEFIDQIESKFKIREVKSFFVIEDIKREMFLTDPNFLPE